MLDSKVENSLRNALSTMKAAIANAERCIDIAVETANSDETYATITVLNTLSFGLANASSSICKAVEFEELKRDREIDLLQRKLNNN